MALEVLKRLGMLSGVRRRVVIAAILLAAAPNWSAPAQQSREQKQAPGRKGEQSLTGCIDEQDGQYVLIHDQTRALIVRLEADGFPTEGFARHLGHKVTVRGTGSPNGAERPVFKVRRIETLSESCAPGEHSESRF